MSESSGGSLVVVAREFMVVGAGRPASKRGGGYEYLHVAVDDHSQVAFVQIRDNENGVTFAEFLTDALSFSEQLGGPSSVS